MTLGPDLSRREFMLGGVAVLPLNSGDIQLQTSPTTAEDLQFQTAAHLLGPYTARPEPGDPFFERKLAYAYIYRATDDSRVSILTDEDEEWSTLPGDGPWADFEGDGLLELSNYDGIDIETSRAERMQYTSDAGGVEREITYDDNLGELVVIRHE